MSSIIATNVRTIGTIPTNSSFGNRYLRIRHFSRPCSERNLLRFFFKPKLSIASVSEQEAPIQTGALRKHLKLTIHNTGSIAENCDATLTLIKHNSTSKLQPSGEEKNLLWDTGDVYRTIGAKKGKAILYVVFSQDSFTNPQNDPMKGSLPENEKIYAKISTPSSLNHLDIQTNLFAEDGVGIGDTFFKLFVRSITGISTEAIFKVSVTDNWHDLSMEPIT